MVATNLYGVTVVWEDSVCCVVVADLRCGRVDVVWCGCCVLVPDLCGVAVLL